MTTILFIVIISICSFIQGLLSFGGGLVMIPLLSLIFDIKSIIIPFLSLFNIFSNTTNLVMLRKSIDIHDHKYLYIAGCIGTLIGANILLNLVDKAALEWLIFFIIIAHSALTLIVKKEMKVVSHKGEVALGLISGLFGGSVGLGSFGIALFYKKLAKDQLKSLIASFCLIGNFITLFSFIFQGRYTQENTTLFLISLIPAFLSHKLGASFSQKVNNENFNKIINSALIVFAIIILLF
jgi:hypothetical protein